VKKLRKEDLVGLDVIDYQGTNLGSVSDLEFTSTGKLFLIVEYQGKEKSISFNSIKAIGDLILLKQKTVKTPSN
jgi:sporulation protein YlmC with PRC-barrel domain